VANPNPIQLDDQGNSTQASTLSPSMARLNALKRLNQLKVSRTSSASAPATTSTQPVDEDRDLQLEEDFFGTASNPPISSNVTTTPLPVASPIEEEEVDWEALFAATTKKSEPDPVVEESSILADFEPLEPVSNSQDELSFLPPTIQEDLAQQQIQQQITQALPDISMPDLDDSSDFFSPPFEVLSPVNSTPITNPTTPGEPTLVDQIQLKPEPIVQVPDPSKLQIIENTDSYPLTLMEDPTYPNPITQMLKKLQGQFGNQIKEAMRRARENIRQTTKSFNNKGGDASNLEASLFVK
jgi:hypothetical protein